MHKIYAIYSREILWQTILSYCLPLITYSLYLEAMFIEKFSGAGVGVSKGIAVFRGRLDFTIYSFKKLMFFLHKLVRQNNVWLNVCFSVFKRSTEFLSLCRNFDLVISQCSVSNVKCNVFSCFYVVSVNVVLFCVLMYIFILFFNFFYHLIYAFYVLYTVFCHCYEINFIINVDKHGRRL